LLTAVCDDTQNLNETESETFFRYRIRYFFRYHFFPIPKLILFSIPKFSDTESETTKKMEKFRNREVSKPKRHLNYPKSEQNLIQNFFRYQIFSIPNPILFPIPNFSDTETDPFFDTKIFRYRIRNHQKNGKVSKPRSFETETSHSGVGTGN